MTTPRVGQILCYHKEDLYLIVTEANTEVNVDSLRAYFTRVCQIYDFAFDDPFAFRMMNKHNFDKYTLIP